MIETEKKFLFFFFFLPRGFAAVDPRFTYACIYIIMCIISYYNLEITFLSSLLGGFLHRTLVVYHDLVFHSVWFPVIRFKCLKVKCLADGVYP